MAKGRGRQGFLRGAVVLTGGMAVVKALGALFKIPLNQAVGEYGMGLFHVAYHFFGPLLSLAGACFPAAVSRLVSESASLGRWNQARQVRRTALPLFVGVGAGGAALLAALAPLYCHWVSGAQMALLPILALAPAIPLSCAAAVLRGYCEGLGNMAPTAVSQVTEALLKVGLGLGLAFWAAAWAMETYRQEGAVLWWRPEGPQEALLLAQALGAAGAVLGVTAGSLASLAYLGLRLRFHGDGTVPRLYRESPPAKSPAATRRELFRAACPMAGGALTASAAALGEATLLQARLGQAAAQFPQELLASCQGRVPPEYLGDPQALPTYLYGCYTLALTVYLLVPGVTQALATSALPEVTAAWARCAKGELRHKLEAVVQAAALLAFPAGLGMAALARPIGALLSGGGPSSLLVGDCLRLLGLASLGAALSSPLSSLLQAVGRPELPMALLAGAMTLKLLVVWGLGGSPQVHVTAAALGSLLAYTLLAAGLLFLVRRITGARIGLGLLVRPLASGALCAASARAAWGALRPAGEALSLAGGVLCGALVYGAAMAACGGLKTGNLQSFPMGQKIAKTLEKRERI